MNAKLLLALTIVGIVFAAGCVGQVSSTGGVTQNDLPDVPQEPEPIPIPTVPDEDRGLYVPPEGSPSIEITSPVDGATLGGTSAVGVRVNVDNYRLVGSKNNLRENEGQIHATLDGPTPKDQYTPFKTFSFTGLNPGSYTLMVELVDNQRNPIGVSQSISITLPGAQ